jgi:hypothetical protein
MPKTKHRIHFIGEWDELLTAINAEAFPRTRALAEWLSDYGYGSENFFTLSAVVLNGDVWRGRLNTLDPAFEDTFAFVAEKLKDADKAFGLCLLGFSRGYNADETIELALKDRAFMELVNMTRDDRMSLHVAEAIIDNDIDSTLASSFLTN